MSRPSKSFRRVQAALLGASACLVVAILVAMSLDPGTPDDWGVEWQRPVEMTVDGVEVDSDSAAFVVALHLWDQQGRATEWDGVVTLQLADEESVEVYSGELAVRAADFTTTRTGDLVDTVYLMRVPFSDIDRVTPRMAARPGTDLSVRATFTTGGETIAAEVRWWLEPVSVRVTSVAVFEDLGGVLVNVVLLDGNNWSTKRTGELRLVIEDSTGFVMYDRSERIVAGDFNELAFWDTGWLWYPSWVYFKDMRKSKDRLEGADGNGPGRCMTVHAWFSRGGVRVGEAGASPVATVRIPDALLMANEPPVPSLDAARWGLTGRQQSFDASGTADDLGTAGLTYEWSWGDGSLREVTDRPFANHTFAREGTYTVGLRVTDREGASSTVNSTVDVIRLPWTGPWDGWDDREGARSGGSDLMPDIGVLDTPMTDVVSRAR